MKRVRNGFTLVELVVVVLVLGIIAAVAAPKMFDTAGNARENTVIQSLAVVRDAIELYKAQTGAYPGDGGTEGDFTADLKPFLRGPFPKNTLTAAEGDRSVKVKTEGDPLSASGDEDWKYDNSSGELIINTTGYDSY